MKQYSEEHQWVEIAGGLATVGVSAFAAGELGEVTFVELPHVGQLVRKGEPLCVVESMKAAADLTAPISGKIVEVNSVLERNPSFLNQSPEADGWLCRLAGVREDELASLMGKKAYEAFLG